MDQESRRVANSQRDRCYRKHHGWVRAKRCGFCEKLCHTDEMGVQAPPWRVRVGGGEAVHKCLTWYCCTQCASSLSTKTPGWHRRAPLVQTFDSAVPDGNPAFKQARKQAKPSPQPMFGAGRGENGWQIVQHGRTRALPTVWDHFAVEMDRMAPAVRAEKDEMPISKGSRLSWADDVVFGSF